MKAKLVSESLKENEEYDAIDSVVEEPMEFDNYSDDRPIYNEVESVIDNELEVPEYSREPLAFRVKDQGSVQAIPMAKTKDGAVLMKVGGSYKKFKMEDLIEDDEF